MCDAETTSEPLAECDAAPAPRSLWTRLTRPTRNERRRLLRTEAWIFVIASYVLVAFAYLWPPDFRNQSSFYIGVTWTSFMIRTFLYHFGLLLVVMAIVAAGYRQRRLALAALPLLIVTVGPDWWNFRPKSLAATTGEAVTVMSVNLLMVNQTTAGIITEIQAAQPDLLLLQEYAPQWHAALQDAVGDDYPYVVYEIREDSFGVAIYSRRPFVNPGRHDIVLGRGLEPQYRSVVQIAGRNVAVYSVHLYPPWGMEYTREGWRQFADLRDQLKAETLPVILAGDFNHTAKSPQAWQLANLGFADVHDTAGWGRGTTWPINSFFRWVPSLRLDHIYLSRELTCTSAETGQGQGSDHRPVIAEVAFRRGQ